MTATSKDDADRWPLWSWLACAAIVAASAVLLLGMGRTLWCKGGEWWLWSGDIWSMHNSQHLLDAYSFSHVLHGFLFYSLFALPLVRSIGHGARLVSAVAVEAAWEILENTNMMIDRYREVTISLDYFGDTVFNSVADIATCVAGYVLAAWLPALATASLFVIVELVMLVWIRDGLLLNVLMLVWPLQEVREWQMGAAAMPPTARLARASVSGAGVREEQVLNEIRDLGLVARDLLQEAPGPLPQVRLRGRIRLGVAHRVRDEPLDPGKDLRVLPVALVEPRQRRGELGPEVAEQPHLFDEEMPVDRLVQADDVVAQRGGPAARLSGAELGSGVVEEAPQVLAETPESPVLFQRVVERGALRILAHPLGSPRSHGERGPSARTPPAHSVTFATGK